LEGFSTVALTEVEFLTDAVSVEELLVLVPLLVLDVPLLAVVVLPALVVFDESLLETVPLVALVAPASGFKTALRKEFRSDCTRAPMTLTPHISSTSANETRGTCRL